LSILKEFDISGKNIIVTGASRGIGKGITRVLADAGANVLCTALTDVHLNKLVKEISLKGLNIEGLVADNTTILGWDKTINFALEQWGSIDVLINNLGDAISKPIATLNENSGEPAMSDDEWHDVLDINLTHAFMGCRSIGPHFLERRIGKVINISGTAARQGVAQLAAYSAAKAGLVRFTQSLALEWAPYNILVNSIAPGPFPDIDLEDEKFLDERINWAKSNVPLRRFGDLKEVGYLAVYLISDASNYMTGQTIYLDGGLTYA